MKFSNKTIVKIIPVLYLLLIAGIFITNFIAYQSTQINLEYPLRLFALQSILLIGLLIYLEKNAQYFEFDASGEKLILVNQGVFFSTLAPRKARKVEIPKSNFKFYEVKDFFFFRKLIVYFSTRYVRTKKRSFNITFLNNKKQKLVLENLSEISYKNKGSLNGHR